MKYTVQIHTIDTPAGPFAGLHIADENGVPDEAFPLPLLVSMAGDSDKEKGQVADALLAELNWTRTGSWNVTGTWDQPGMHMYADVWMTRELETWPAGKLFGELAPEQKAYQARKAGQQLTAEMAQPSVVAAISNLLDEDDAAAVERHLGL